MILAKLMWDNPTEYCEGWNFGPEAEGVSTVWEVASEVIKNYGSGELKDSSDSDAVHEANLLMLDITKAEQVLGWVPTYTAQEAVAKTIAWYKRFYQGEPMLAFTLQQIHEYEERILWKKN